MQEGNRRDEVKESPVMDDPFRTAELIVNELTDGTGDIDQEELKNWVDAEPSNQRLYLKIKNGDGLAQFREESSRYDLVGQRSLFERFLKRRERVHMLWRVSTVAAVLIPIVAGIFFLTVNVKEDGSAYTSRFEHIEPGKSRAELVLGDGTVVILGEGSGQNILIGDNIIAREDHLTYVNEESGNNPEIHTLSVARGREFFLQLEDGTKV